MGEVKIASVRVNCRGCDHGAVIKFEAPTFLKAAHVPFQCKKCGSELLAEIKKKFNTEQIAVRVKMVSHTQTLMNILKRRKHA